MAKRNLPIGIEFYKKVIDEAYFYVDKTLIIKELLDRQSLCQPVYQTQKIWKNASA